MGKGRLLLSEESVRNTPFSVGAVAYGCINGLFEEGFLDVPIERIEGLVEEIAAKLDVVFSLNKESTYRAKINLIHSKDFKVKWRSHERCFEYLPAQGGSGIVEQDTSDGSRSSVSIYFMTTLKKTDQRVHRHKSIARQYRAEASLYARAEPVLQSIIDEHLSRDSYINDAYAYLKILLREELMDLSELFVEDVMKKITYS